jgi:TPP-dependent pyruvate/acetoin dehydrogenase alpha subunit
MVTKEELIAFSTKVAQLWEAKEFRVPVHLAGGNEDQLIEIFKEVEENDYIFSSHRNMYHALLAGVPANDLLDSYKKDPQGRLGANGGCMCIMDHGRKFYASAIVGGNVAPAVGVAWALKDQQQSNHVWCFVGDGATDTGHFWEGLNYAESWDLPITFIVENNNRSVETTIEERWGSYGLILDEDQYTKVRIYYYENTYPHIGNGVFIHF